MTDISTKKS